MLMNVPLEIKVPAARLNLMKMANWNISAGLEKERMNKAIFEPQTSPSFYESSLIQSHAAKQKLEPN